MKAIAAALAQVAHRHGGLAALVNKAGRCFMSDFPDIAAAELGKQMALNLIAAF